MPKLNLKDDGMDSDFRSLPEGSPTMTTPMLRQSATGGGGASPLLIVLLLIIILGGGAFALNYFGIVHLWGKKAKVVTEAMPPPAQVTPKTDTMALSATKPSTTTTPKQTPAPTPDLTPTPAMTQPPASTFKPPTSTTTTPTTKPLAATTTKPLATTPGLTPQPEKSKPVKTETPRPVPAVASSPTGNYVVQVASWEDVNQAQADVDKLTAAGFHAFVEDAVVRGQTWHRVRVGRYSSEQEAHEAAGQLQKMYSEVWVARSR